MSKFETAFIAKSRSLLAGEYLPKIQKSLTAISDEQIWWRSGPETNSIGNLLLHLSGNARQWIVSGVGEQLDHRQRQTEFDASAGQSREKLLEQLQQTVNEVDAVLANFDTSKLLETRQIQNHDVSVIDAIYHVVEHFAMHTGQIIYLAKMLGQKDLGFYKFVEGAPRSNWS
ncbi:MAG: DinB family protein [Pyrinomonadaceae bacterium]